MQIKSALRHSYHAVLYINVGLYLKQALTVRQYGRAGAVV